ncbi:excinuclease ABC subunit C, partial [Listeria monocytogenes]|nr:excinuclease ABC subunit C [Listeria monocytogenes]
FSSKLDEIPGLGPKRKQQLMKTFKSLKNIQAASVEEIQQAGIPKAVAETILAKLGDQNQPTS